VSSGGTGFQPVKKHGQDGSATASLTQKSLQPHNLQSSPRQGVVLILVVVVIALLTLVCFTFSELMLSERKAVVISGRQSQALAAADSGVQMARVFLLNTKDVQDQAGGSYDNSTLFRGALVVNDPSPNARLRCTIVAPLLENGIPTGIRFGLENESAKLNINNILQASKSTKKSSSSGGSTAGSSSTGSSKSGGSNSSGSSSSGGGASSASGASSGTGSTSTSASGTTSTASASDPRTLLMNLPGMTQDIADSILDWLDTDDQPREYGAETEYYSTLQPPYQPKNGPLSTVEELLLVRGVTPALLFGNDVNRNGRIDPDEATSNISIPGVDNSDGSMNQGWSAYLTLYSKENNLQANGQPKINLNESDLEQLSTDLQAVQLTDDQLQFILAYRLYGPYTDPNASTKDVNSERAAPATLKSPTPRASNNSKSPDSKSSGNQPDLTQKGVGQLSSILDLIGAKVSIPAAQGQGGGQPGKPTILPSPFTNSSSDMIAYLPLLMDSCTVNTSPEIVGRININQASKSVLLSIPGMTPDVVDEIIARRTMDTKGADISHKYETWLLTEGIVTLKQMKALEPYVTCGGDVYRIQAIGYFDDGGVAARIEAIVDASTQPATVLFWRDISHLGRGFTLEELGSQSSQ
jgi:type II secretory pathway component PulK